MVVLVAGAVTVEILEEESSLAGLSSIDGVYHVSALVVLIFHGVGHDGGHKGDDQEADGEDLHYVDSTWFYLKR